MRRRDQRPDRNARRARRRAAGCSRRGDAGERRARVRDRFAQLARGLYALHRRASCIAISSRTTRVTPEGRVLLTSARHRRATARSPAPSRTWRSMPRRAGAVSADWFSRRAAVRSAVGRVPWIGSARRSGKAARSRAVARGARRDPAAIRRARRRSAAARSGRATDADGGSIAGSARSRAARAQPGATICAPSSAGARAALLATAWSAVVAGGSAWLAFEGRSGVGKTTLLDALAGSVDGAVVVGRCYEREAAVQGSIDRRADRRASGRAWCAVSRSASSCTRPRRVLARPTSPRCRRRGSHDRRGARAAHADQPARAGADHPRRHPVGRSRLPALVSHALSPPGIPRVMFVAGTPGSGECGPSCLMLFMPVDRRAAR